MSPFAWPIGLAAVGVGLGATVLAMRRRLVSVVRERDALLKQGAVISATVRELTTLHRPEDVIATAVKIAAELISPSAREGRRAVYFVVEGDTARVVAQLDESAGEAIAPIKLADHPALTRVVKTNRPMRTTFEPSSLGPRQRRGDPGAGRAGHDRPADRLRHPPRSAACLAADDQP